MEFFKRGAGAVLSVIVRMVAQAMFMVVNPSVSQRTSAVAVVNAQQGLIVANVVPVDMEVRELYSCPLTLVQFMNHIAAHVASQENQG